MVSLTFIPQTTFPCRARHSTSQKQEASMCSHGNENSTPTSVSRRALLLAASAACCINVESAMAYSSPYKPGQKEDKPLPGRLYDASQVVTTSSGLRYFDLSTGNGPEAKPGDTALVYYTSRLGGLNGIKIQSTFDDPNSPPFIFKIGASDVVPGVSETVQGMRVGGKRRAVIPPSIGYKNADMRPEVKEFFARRRLLSVLETSRDATVVFDFELIKIK